MQFNSEILTRMFKFTLGQSLRVYENSRAFELTRASLREQVYENKVRPRVFSSTSTFECPSRAVQVRIEITSVVKLCRIGPEVDSHIQTVFADRSKYSKCVH